MDTYKADYIIPLMIGGVFICVGAYIGLLAGRLNRETEASDSTSHLPAYMRMNRLAASSRIFRMCFGAVFVLVGLTIAIGSLSGPSPAENRRHDRRILALSAGDVRSAVLDREYTNPAVDQSINLVRKPIEITDKGDIASICTALRSAKSFSPNHPTGRWYCSLTLVTTDGPIEIRVERTTNQGVILWLRHEYRCDEMGAILESIAER